MTVKNRWEKIAGIFMILAALALAAVFIKAFLDGKFDSVDTLQAYVRSFGILAPVMLGALQASQVVIPVLPGFLGCAAGAVLFGSMGGFWCNYIGISLGSIAAFLLARKCGVGLVKRIFSERTYEKWSGRIGTGKYYTIILLLIMVLPLFPDDFFCYFTGLTKMRTQKFVGLILIGKPWCILAYSLVFAGVLQG